MKNLHIYEECRQKIVERLANTFDLSSSDAKSVYEALEKASIVIIDPPNIVDRPAEWLMKSQGLPKDKLELTSSKMCNVAINFQKDWREVVGFIISLIGTVAGFRDASQLMIYMGVIGSIVSGSKLLEVKIDEKGTAIILALQNQKRHKAFALSEERCMTEANKILESYGYETMDIGTFADTVNELRSYQCVEVVSSQIYLCERVLFSE